MGPKVIKYNFDKIYVYIHPCLLNLYYEIFNLVHFNLIIIIFL